MWRSRRLQGPAKIQTNIHIHCGLHSIISIASLMQKAIYETIYYMSDYEIYLPWCHAVKTKHDIKALAHFINTISTNASSNLVKFFLLKHLAHGGFNERLEDVNRLIIL